MQPNKLTAHNILLFTAHPFYQQTMRLTFLLTSLGFFSGTNAGNLRSNKSHEDKHHQATKRMYQMLYSIYSLLE
jgi:hypothetical protein